MYSVANSRRPVAKLRRADVYHRQFDYRDLFSQTFAVDTVRNRCGNEVALVSDRHGHSVWSRYSDCNGLLEYTCFDDDVLIVIGDRPKGLTGPSTQLTTDGDWLHMQFRMAGAGTENPLGQATMHVPSGSCAIFRNPSGIQTMRDFAPEPWKVVCLYMRPRSVNSFFGISSSNLSRDFRWMSESGDVGFCSHLMPIDTSSRAIIQDMMNTSLDRSFRRLYMKSKALELFCINASRVAESKQHSSGRSRGWSPTSNVVRAAIDIMKVEIGAPLTLGLLARRVGTNRTRLAQLFKEGTGVTVQAYWRRLRLEYARALLSAEHIPVTEAAARVGYSSISSLTRAFYKEFGYLPKEARRTDAAR
ncbi:helix-turn-helix domain-containing protein [Aminobacter aganoensis]|uniref:AraC-like DNA-binding protein n=1 Tax=Aminobacter aganoensis TaxID=83264 RepID=A0A7X0KNK3_9HYPH|nr:AraC-like DNA-binding protein [Aminobacter aganoensis]